MNWRASIGLRAVAKPTLYGFPPFPHSLEIPSGLPHSHDLDDGIVYLEAQQEQHPEMSTRAKTPQGTCNGCSGTLTPGSHQCATCSVLVQASKTALGAHRRDASPRSLFMPRSHAKSFQHASSPLRS